VGRPEPASVYKRAECGATRIWGTKKGTNWVNSAFDDAMVSVYTRPKDEATWRTTSYRWFPNWGPGGCSGQLLRFSAPSEGFTTLWEKRRLDISVEYHVLLPQFEHLFDSRERETASRCVKDCGFDVSVFDHLEDPI
jgi:hypothetical protein